MKMIWTRDNLTLAGLVILIASLSALAIRSHHISASKPRSFLTGSVLSYEVTVTKGGGTRGYFMVRLDRGDQIRVEARTGTLPGDRVCIRAAQRGELVEGMLVPMDRCTSQ